MGEYECLCGSVLEKSSQCRITDSILGYDATTDYWLCGNCMTMVMESKEAFSVAKVGKFSSDLSEDAYKLLFACVSNVDFQTYYVFKKGKFLKANDLSALSGIAESRINLLIDELWKKRLAMYVKFNTEVVYVINAVLLGIETDQRAFIKRNFFGADFFRVNNKKKESSARRQLLKKSLINDLTDEDKDEILAKFEGKCALTGKDVPLHLDHVIPIAAGHGGTTKSNIIPLWQRINSSKSDSNIFEWFVRNGERFDVCPDRFANVIEYLATLNRMTVSEYRDYVYRCHENPNHNGGITNE